MTCRDAKAVAAAREEHQEAIELFVAEQYIFDKQWTAVKASVTMGPNETLNLAHVIFSHKFGGSPTCTSATEGCSHLHAMCRHMQMPMASAL
jgi:hypothetical protein